MPRLSIQLPDDLRAKVHARASESGHESVEDYVEALLRADADDTGVNDDDVEALLLERIDSTEPGIEVTPAFVEKFRQRIERSRQSGGGPQ